MSLPKHDTNIMTEQTKLTAQTLNTITDPGDPTSYPCSVLSLPNLESRTSLRGLSKILNSYNSPQSLVTNVCKKKLPLIVFEGPVQSGFLF
jgi:hypothetical protein